MKKSNLYYHLFFHAPLLMLLTILSYTIFLSAFLLLSAGVAYIQIKLDWIMLISYAIVMLIILSVITSNVTFCQKRICLNLYVAGASYKQMICLVTRKNYLLIFLSFGFSWYIVNMLDIPVHKLETLHIFHYGIGLLICFAMNMAVTSSSYYLIKRKNPLRERWEA